MEIQKRMQELWWNRKERKKMSDNFIDNADSYICPQCHHEQAQGDYCRNCGFSQDKNLTVIAFPKDATNGDMIKAMFPNPKYHYELGNANFIKCWINETEWIEFDYSWWNSPYKKGVEE